jgi:polysaccharide biosynthesis transport protein
MNTPNRDFLYFLSFLRRRKWQILIPTAVLLALSAAIIKSIAPAYRSSATILIESQEIPAELVRSTTSTFADQRIQVISRQVMTRANLRQIIEKFNLLSEARREKGGTSDAIVERVRRNISLELLSADTTDKRSGSKTSATIAFVLSYEGETPEQAKKVTEELVSLFLNENVKNRQQQVAEAEKFLSEEAQRLEAQIADIEQKLAGFKLRNAGQLPEQSQTNLQLRERAEGELLDAERQLSGLAQRKADLETQIAQVKPFLPAVSASGERVLDSAERLRIARTQYESLVGIYSADHPDLQRLRSEIEGLQRQLSPSQSDSALVQEAERLRGELSALRERYSDEHPDVIRVKTRLAELEALRPGSAQLTLSTQMQQADNPAFIALRAQMGAVQTEINTLRARQRQLGGKLAQYEQRLRETPLAEREYQDITRERENATRRYQEVKAKLMEMRVAQTLEKDSKAERFSLIEPANLPEKPVRPNRLALALLGGILSLGAGLAFGGVREAMDSSVHNVEHLAAASRVPVLASIPDFSDGASGARRLRNAFAALALIVAALAAIHVLVAPLDS